MIRPRLRLSRFGFLSIASFAGAGLLIAACGGASESGGKASGGGGSAGGGKGPTVLGERLTTRTVTDSQQGNMPVGVVAVPEKWQFSSRIVWNYAYYGNPVSAWTTSENPDNAEAVYGYPPAMYFDTRPGGFFQVGQNVGGLVYAHPAAPVPTLAGIVQQIRTGVRDLQFVGSRELPDLPAALNLPPSPNQRGVGIKVTYSLNGQPVEEEFYGVFFQVEVPYDGPAGRTWQINWGVTVLHSFRAPAGTLDKRRPVFAAVAKSFRPNPAWQQRLAAINQYLKDQFDRQIQAGYDAIAAAGRLSQQISANNDAMLATIDQQMRSSPTAQTPEARSAAEKFDDYIRGVDTVEDPYYGTSQHSYDNQFHWTDGYGSYRNSNDPTYDPNRSEVGNWQPMPVIR